MADDFAAIARDAIASLPEDLRAPITFTRMQPTGATTIVGTAVGVPGNLDQYIALNLVQSTARTLVFVPDVAGELPEEGDTVEWGGITYVVKASDPTAPAGQTFAARVVLSR